MNHRQSERQAFSCDPKEMQAIRSGARWVIEHTTYFDGDRQIWREADIEICSGEIVGVRAPGTSRASIRRNARGHGKVKTVRSHARNRSASRRGTPSGDHP
ncbi:MULTISPECIES: hypothetical protein [unclassified Burkholderia]|uniref:hypothetical protein n=1 Tax=unclassified Burkholderia TaxID=2613784 RepID=UPI000A7135E8|nr:MULTISPECIES: hypothetical protein [unclassified Burkholderia]